VTVGIEQISVEEEAMEQSGTADAQKNLNPTLAQIAMCTKDIPRSVELLTGALGFLRTRAEVMSGKWLAQVQELGDDGSIVIFWLVDSQEFMQLEVVYHFEPVQRLLPDDWRPSDHGWVRWGMEVDDIDGCVRRLADRNISTITPVQDFGALGRRVSFRDPYVGVMVELIQKGEIQPASDEVTPPKVVYATVSVPDMAVARRFWIDTLGLIEEPSSVLHTPPMEALWGLDDAKQDSFVARAGDRYFEVVEYHTPKGRPPAPDRLLSDQGIMNPSVGYRDRAALDACVERIVAAGGSLSAPLSPFGLPAGSYTRAPDGTSVEMYSVAREYDTLSGFTPAKKEETAASMMDLLLKNV
jgi:catechol 2,3-dioxygenase-like lactoylglutathione lyase family enzyme